MTAGVYNLEIEQGATLLRTISVVEDSLPKDLTGWTARSQVRRSATSSLLFEIPCTIADAVGGVVEMSMTAAATSAIPTPNGTAYNARAVYVYDLEIDNGSGEVIRLLNGSCFVSPEVTK